MNTIKQLRVYASIVWSDSDIVEIRPLPVNKGRQLWITAGEIIQAVDAMTEINQAGANIYAGVCPRTKSGGSTNADVEFSRVAWFDFDNIDYEGVKKILADNNFPMPTMAVNSGHGVHVFYRLSTEIKKDQLVPFLKSAIKQLGADKAAHDPARILRLPGFINHKPPVADCKIITHDNSVFNFNDLVKLINIEQPKTITPQPTSDPDIQRARAYINEIPGEPEGNRNAAGFRVATILRNDFDLNESDAMMLFGEWNNTCQPPMDEKELASVFKSAGKHAQKPKGNKKVEVIQLENDADDFDIDAFLERSQRASLKKENKKDPLPMMPGLVSEMAEYLNSATFNYQPEFAQAISISLLGAMLGRKICDPSDCRTNVFFLGVLAAGKGKTQFQKPVRKIMKLSCCENLIAPNRFASDTALIKWMEVNGVTFWYPEEFGKYMDQIKKSSNAAHMTGFLNEVLQFYSAANDAYGGKAYADPKFNIEPIYNPHLCLFGTACPSNLEDAFDSKNISDGLLPRFFLIHGDNNPKKNPTPNPLGDPPDDLTGALSQIYLWQPAYGNLVNVNAGNGKDMPLPEPLVIPMAPAAAVKINTAKEQSEINAKNCEKTGELWYRWEENSRRLALIYAVSQAGCIEKAEITAEAATWALRYTAESIERMAEMAHDYLADNYGHAQRNKILRRIKNASSRTSDGWVSHSVIYKNSGMSKQEFNAVIETLADQEFIQIGERETYRGRNAKYYLINS